MNFCLTILTIIVYSLSKCMASERINVGITFTKAAANENLRNKFKLCVSSLLKYASVDIDFYIIGDLESQTIAKKIFSSVKNLNKINYEVNEFV